MKIIYKYKIDLGSQFEIELPESSEILRFGIQNDTLYTWVLVDPNLPPQKRKFRVFGTGQGIPENELPNMNYLSTIDIDYFAWHIFEVIK